MPLGVPMDTQQMYSPFHWNARDNTDLFFPQLESTPDTRDRKCAPCTKEHNNDIDGPMLTSQTTLILTSWKVEEQVPAQAKFLYTCTVCGNMQIVSEKLG